MYWIRIRNPDFDSSTIRNMSPSVWWIHIILIRIRIQDVKKFVADPEPGLTLVRIRIQAKTIRIRIQKKGLEVI